MNYDDIEFEWVQKRTAELREEVPEMSPEEIVLKIVELEQKLKKARWMISEKEREKSE